MNTDKQKIKLKIVSVGDPCVGKTHFLHRYIDKNDYRFEHSYIVTIGCEFKAKTVEMPDYNVSFSLQFWDISGQERFMSTNRIFYKEMHALLVSIDLTNEDINESIDNVLKWIEDVKVKFELSNHNLTAIPVLIIGNKSDVISTEKEDKFRQIIEERMKREMNQIYVHPNDRNKKIKMEVIGYEFTSARNDMNVKESMDRLLTYICENQLDNFPKVVRMIQKDNRITVDGENNRENNKKCC